MYVSFRLSVDKTWCAMILQVYQVRFGKLGLWHIEDNNAIISVIYPIVNDLASFHDRDGNTTLLYGSTLIKEAFQPGSFFFHFLKSTRSSVLVCVNFQRSSDRRRRLLTFQR